MGKGKRAYHSICNYVTRASRLFQTHTHTHVFWENLCCLASNKQESGAGKTHRGMGPTSSPEHELPETKLLQPKANSYLDPAIAGDIPSSFSHPAFPVPSGRSRDFSCCVSRVGDRLQEKFNRGEHTHHTPALSFLFPPTHFLPVCFGGGIKNYLQHWNRNNHLVAFSSHYSDNHRIPGWIPGIITPCRTKSRDSIDPQSHRPQQLHNCFVLVQQSSSSTQKCNAPRPHTASTLRVCVFSK